MPCSVEDVSIHVLVAGLPRLLSEVLSAGLATSSEVSLVGVTDERARPGSQELDVAIRTHKPDAAIVGMKDDETEALERTQLRHRCLAILAVSPDGARAWNLALRTELQPVDALSPSALRTAIRRAVASKDKPTSHFPDPSGITTLATEPEGT